MTAILTASINAGEGKSQGTVEAGRAKTMADLKIVFDVDKFHSAHHLRIQGQKLLNKIMEHGWPPS